MFSSWCNQCIPAFGLDLLVPPNGRQPGKIQEAHSNLPDGSRLARSACPTLLAKTSECLARRLLIPPNGTAWDWCRPTGTGLMLDGRFVDADDD